MWDWYTICYLRLGLSKIIIVLRQSGNSVRAEIVFFIFGDIRFCHITVWDTVSLLPWLLSCEIFINAVSDDHVEMCIITFWDDDICSLNRSSIKSNIVYTHMCIVCYSVLNDISKASNYGCIMSKNGLAEAMLHIYFEVATNTVAKSQSYRIIHALFFF